MVLYNRSYKGEGGLGGGAGEGRGVNKHGVRAIKGKIKNIKNKVKVTSLLHRS